MRRMLGQLLAQEGHEVVAEAADGREVVELYQRHSPDVVILDVCLPEVDGIVVTAALCSADPRARVIICTAVADAATLRRAVAAGARDFLVKPISRERLVTALRAVAAGGGVWSPPGRMRAAGGAAGGAAGR
jgi:two-component system chemotaxis response regulator CheY